MRKFIQNKSDAQIICATKDQKKKWTFRNVTTDKMTGAVVFAGFTPISDEDLALMTDEANGSVVFKRYSDRGMLVVVDSIPSEYQTVAEQLSVAASELAAAKEEIEALKEKLEKVSSSDSKDELAKAKKENEALKARLSSAADELTAGRSGLEAAKAAEDTMAIEIVALKEELEAAKAELEKFKVGLSEAAAEATDK